MTKLQGCDVSLWNGRPDWKVAVAAGMKWVAVKASQGATITDPQCARNVDCLRELGVPVMLYHYLYPGVPAVDQWERFHSVVEHVGGWDGMLVPALDVEGDEHCQLRGVSADEYLDEAAKWLDLLHDEKRIEGVVYTYPSFNSEYGVGDRLGGLSDIWAAKYGTTAPHFTGWRYTWFWQYSDQGSWPGIGSGLDMDWFLGTEQELRSLIVNAKRAPLVVGPDGKPIDCEPQWERDSITVAAIPLLKALGLPLIPLPTAVHEHTGRAYIRELEPSLTPWRMAYRDMPQGPRVYIKRGGGAA